MNSSEQQRFDDLLHRSFRGELSEKETAHLRDWMHRDPDAVDRYLEHCHMEAWLSDPALSDSPDSGKVLAPDFEATSSAGLPRPRLLSGSAAILIATGVSLVAVGWIFLFQGQKAGLYTVHSNGVQSTVRQESVARVMRVEGVGTVNESGSLQAGDELFPGDRIALQRGLVEMAFRDSGVHVVATGPLDLIAETTGKLFLRDGEVKLVVPPQGIGFVVETEERKYTDLGTSFVVTSRPEKSKVLVLNGQITVENRDGSGKRLMNEGELADFDREGKLRMRSRRPSGVPELPLRSLDGSDRGFVGNVFGFQSPPVGSEPNERYRDYIGPKVLPLIESGFQNSGSLDGLKQSRAIPFRGIAGTYNQLPFRAGLDDYSRRHGWLAWYRGKLTPPAPGKYRFWGYADNKLLIAVDGRPVFEGSRYDSVFRRDMQVRRTDHPSLPCLNSEAGFACGPWLELDGSAVRVDIMFGEIFENQTSGLLLVEKQGSEYQETFWGQPKWPLFLVQSPSGSEATELRELRNYLEERLMGSFSLPDREVWRVAE